MKDKIISALRFLKINKKELEELIEFPRDSSKGDYAFPCFAFSKKLKKNPVEIAKDIASKVKSKEFEKVEASGGYVNFFVNGKDLAEEVIGKIEKEGDNYGGSKMGKRIMIEFSQPNTHKAFHVGHIRGTSLGESLARIKEFSGNKVVRANYSGDTGMHIAKWLWYYNKFHKKEKLRNNEGWIASIYVDAIKRLEKNEKLQEEVDEINRKLDSGEDGVLNKLWKNSRKLSVESWEKIYHELGTRFDIHFFESEVEQEGKKIAKDLEKKKVAEISDGATIINLEEYGLGVWVLLRRDGTVLYSAKDIALAEKKFREYKLDSSLIITDRAQDLHFRQLVKTLELMKIKWADKYLHKSYGSIRLPWGKMSSRTGDNVLYSEFKDKMVKQAEKEVVKRYKLESVEVSDRALAIAMAAIKYAVLKQDMNKDIVFNPKESLKFEGDTGPYLLYSYARAQSILDKADYKASKKYKIEELNEWEKRLVWELGRFPEVVKNANENLAPNLIANFSFELAKTFSDFYQNVRVLLSENEQFKLKLVDCYAQTIKNALNLLGIVVIRKM